MLRSAPDCIGAGPAAAGIAGTTGGEAYKLTRGFATPLFLQRGRDTAATQKTISYAPCV